MGITLGWIALLLVGAPGAPPAEHNAAPICYTVKMVEAEGVGWRASAMSHLRPVARQGAATVWTLPKGATKSLIHEISKKPSGVVVQSPRLVALSGMPAAIQIRQNRKFVTQVAWDGDEAAPKGSPEEVRVGWHSTIVGRKLDQGILVKIVFEDTEIRGVYNVPIARLSEASRSKSESTTPERSDADVKAAGMHFGACDASPFNQVDSSATDETALTRCDETGRFSNLAQVMARKGERENQFLEVPEIANQEVLGEWLIPNGECLLVSFGPHTVADKSGKAVVRERLAFVEADEQTNVMASSGRRSPTLRRRVP